MKVKLPAYIEELKDGPHKRDLIRHYKRKIREEPNSKRWGDNFKIYNGDCLEKLDELAENSIDCIVTDPPYELNFMGKGWDNAGISFQTSTWAKCLRVLKPGGYILAFGGSRTFHRITCAIEDAGFEIRDTIMWLYGSGFPKSMNIGKKTGLDEWAGWGTALKPSFEPIIVARKPFKGSCVDNVIKYGVGGINIDECRIPMVSEEDAKNYHFNNNGNNRLKKNEGEKLGAYDGGWKVQKGERENPTGRFPANTILTYDETDFDEVCGGFPNTAPTKPHNGDGKKLDTREMGWGFRRMPCSIEDNGGSAARYFYCAKASKKDRDEGLEEFVKDITDDGRDKPIDNPYLRGKTLRHNTHPTVKPTSLMQYLVRLVAPMGATILDPFMGSGSTGKAVMFENKERQAGYKFIGIEKDPEYCKIAEARINCAKGGQWQMNKT